MTDAERKSVIPARIYVGVPTRDMDSLRDILQGSGMSFDLKIDIITRIMAFILDRSSEKRWFEQVTQDKVFVERSESVRSDLIFCNMPIHILQFNIFVYLETLRPVQQNYPS